MTAQEQHIADTMSPTAGPPSRNRLLDAAVMIGSGLDLRELLERIVEAAVDLVDARYGALAVLDKSGRRLGEWITVGLDDDPGASNGDPPQGLGLLGSLIVDPAPLRVALLSEHPANSGFPPEHPPMTSFLRIPIRVSGEDYATLYLTNKAESEPFTNVDEESAVGLAAAAGAAIENARLYEEGRLREAAMTAIKAVATAVLGGSDRTSSLELVARQARKLLNAELATIALPDASGRRLVVDISDGPGADAVRGVRPGIAGGLADDVFSTGEAAVVDRASRHDRVPPEQLPAGRAGPALFLALIANGQPFGVLTLARGERAPPFTAAELEEAQSFANQASLVLVHDQVRQQREQLRLLEDRERIGRDLHDTVIQRLFATGLELQGAVRLISDADARLRVNNAVNEVDRTIAHIRDVIFDIETSNGESGSSVRAKVLELAHHAARGLGFQPRILFTGTVDSTVAGHLLTDVLAAIQEALSNVVRHADASQVDLELTVDEAVTLCVVDDGIGMPADRHCGHGHGVANMRARAERLGGTLDVNRTAKGGTEVRWRVPLRATEVRLT